MIHLNETIYYQIAAHAERDYPHECGGMLLGSYDGETRIVTELIALQNAREEEARYDRILILPADVLKAERYAAENGLDVIGYYHSHPDDEAIPSEYDREHALPMWSYVIASVRNRATVDVRSWVLENDRTRFNEEECNSFATDHRSNAIAA